jgi:superfamily I DNA and/or RNA helicase
MMSPSTVASLVPREVIEQFDLVIVDEASQMPPERAFGVISRAKQCVVVGDPKQLPPTSFFMRSSSSEETEDSEEVDIEALDEESILDLCTKSFKPVRRLKWHYRSRHGSLIAFSNRQFYNNQLVVFPSCDREFAINRHLVEAPRYVRSINLPEVTLVCDVVLEQLELHPERSLGVVAMNESQAEEISEQLETLSIHHEELRRRLDLTDMVHSAKYEFQIAHGQVYWLAQDHRKNELILCGMGPTGWSSGAPEEYEYIIAVRWLGDHTWREVKDENEST